MNSQIHFNKSSRSGSSSKNDYGIKGTILMMAGGTGGHIFPGLAVANELIRRQYSVEWLGTEKGLESILVPKNNIKLNTISVEGVRGRGFVTKLSSPFMLFKAIFQAFYMMKKIRPSLVIGMGGFASGPGGIAAKLLRIPLLIHEQNAVSGTTNKWLAKFANKIVCAFPDVLPRSEFVGNPLRQKIESVVEPLEREKLKDEIASKTLNILVLGGSRGARFINELMPKTMKLLDGSQYAPQDDSYDKFRKNIKIVHQTGEADLSSTQKAYDQCSYAIEVHAFIDDISQAMSQADLIICRAGALTVSEISAVGVASILIPFPYAIDDHQTANANFLVEANAAVLKQQTELSPEVMLSLIANFIEDKSQLISMAINARKVAKRGVSNIIANMCEELIYA